MGRGHPVAACEVYLLNVEMAVLSLAHPPLAFRAATPKR